MGFSNSRRVLWQQALYFRWGAAALQHDDEVCHSNSYMLSSGLHDLVDDLGYWSSCKAPWQQALCFGWGWVDLLWVQSTLCMCRAIGSLKCLCGHQVGFRGQPGTWPADCQWARSEAKVVDYFRLLEQQEGPSAAGTVFWMGCFCVLKAQ